MSWLHCRSCGSRERRSDLAMMMMTQKKLLVSGIRWQVGRRRKGKPSSSLFGQIFLWLHELSRNSLPSHRQWIFSELLKKLGSPPGKQLPLFCFTSYRLSLAHCGTMGLVFLSETPDHHLWTWKQLWSGPARSQRGAVWMQLSHCCSLSHYPKSLSAPGVR